MGDVGVLKVDLKDGDYYGDFLYMFLVELVFDVCIL